MLIPSFTHTVFYSAFIGLTRWVCLHYLPAKNVLSGKLINGLCCDWPMARTLDSVVSAPLVGQLVSCWQAMELRLHIACCFGSNKPQQAGNLANIRMGLAGDWYRSQPI